MSAQRTTLAPEPPIQPAAIRAVLYREWRLFRRLWFSTAFGSLVEPILYLLAFGFGFGALVSDVAGIPYLEFVATGVVATGVLFSSVFPGLFQSFFRRKYQHTYDGVLAAPVDVPDVVTAEAVWLALRSAIVALVPLCVAFAFGLRFSWVAVLLVPLIGAVTGFGFGLFGIAVAAVLPSINSVDYVISGIITPLFLVAGTFFPLDRLPPWVEGLSQVNPLYHCVELVRGTVFGFDGPGDLWHLGALVVFGALMWLAATRLLHRALVD